MVAHLIKKPELSYCPTLGTPYLMSDSNVLKKRTILKTRCKLWDCPYCGQVNAHQHRIRILNAVNKLQGAGYKFDFVTLTSHEKLSNLEQTLHVWRKAWRKLCERLRRLHKKTLGLPPQYVYIPETHKNGRIHIHGLFTGGIQKQWWKNNARACGLGYMVDTQHLENAGQATAYITKYIVKNIGQKIPAKSFRRICYSQGFPPKPVINHGFEWEIIKDQTSLETLIVNGWDKGMDIDFMGKKITEIIYD